MELRSRVCLLLALAPLAVAACRGSHDHPTQHFAARAEAICAGLNRSIRTGSGLALSAREIARLSPQNAALERRAIDELATLKPPARMRRDWERTLALRRELAAQLIVLARDERTRNTRAVAFVLATKKQTRRELLAVASRGGFKQCAKVG